MVLAWYNIVVTDNTLNTTALTGTFSVESTNNTIQRFYNGTNYSANVLQDPFTFSPATIVQAGQLKNTTSTNNYNNGTRTFSIGGTIITAAADNPYGASKWVIWTGVGPADKLNYLAPSGLWTNLAPASFTITSVADPACFNEGTKILCLNKHFEEEYIPIENLRKGDLVKSYKHGYRKIDLIGKNHMINNPEKWYACMYKMKKTEENGLLEDLIITGAHAILVDNLGDYKEENDKLSGETQMIDDKYLLLSAVSKDFIKLENTNEYTYYHFILENNGNDAERFCVWSNGVLTETPPKGNFKLALTKRTLFIVN
jgi:hypothetical protein